MTSPKRKPARHGKKGQPAARAPRSRRQAPAAEPPLRQGLLELATIGAQSFLWLVMTVATLAALAGAAFGIWSLRPLPEYSSEGITAGSPFAATFRIENASPWFSLSHLKIRCALMDMPPVDANGPQGPASLGPRESTTFTCPLRSVLGGSANDDLEVALRSELYFRSDYDVPVVGSLRLADDRGPFVLNTRLLPPRWTARPDR